MTTWFNNLLPCHAMPASCCDNGSVECSYALRSMCSSFAEANPKDSRYSITYYYAILILQINKTSKVGEPKVMLTEFNSTTPNLVLKECPLQLVVKVLFTELSS